MGRTVVNRVNQPRGRRTTDYLVIAGAAAILLFAVVGVVSAGAFVANKVSSSSATPTPSRVISSSTRSAAAQDVARAQAQATAIVRTAQQASRALVADSTKRAKRRAASIVAAAKHRSVAAQVPRPLASIVLPTPTASPPVTASGPGTVLSTSSGQSASQIPATGSIAGAATSSSSLGASSPVGAGASRPDLRSVPASWLVVGYNASFGGGPGTAGSISVINRSAKVFSGVARVAYASGSSASAPFANLAPGQTLVLPLNGPRYLGGGYHIIVMNVH